MSDAREDLESSLERVAQHGLTWRALAERLAEVMEVVAAPLRIDGPDHAAAVQHARDVLAAYAAATKTGQSPGA